MSVDRAHADRIAHLARLRFADEELTHVTADLNHILEHVESLRGLEGGGGDARAAAGDHATGGAPTVAECSPTRGTGAEAPDRLGRDLADVAPDWREGFFVVPPLPGLHPAEGARE